MKAEEIIQSMESLFEEASKADLLFFHGGLSGPLYFTPAELREEHKHGRFIWGPINWQLVSKQDYIDLAQREVDRAQKNLESAKSKLL